MRVCLRYYQNRKSLQLRRRERLFGVSLKDKLEVMKDGVSASFFFI